MKYIVKYVVIMQHSSIELEQGITVRGDETLIQAIQKFMKKNHKIFSVPKDHEIALISFEAL